MKFYLILLSVLSLSYSSINNASNKNSIRCKNQVTSIDNQELNSEICIKKTMFNPNIYKVKINNTIVFTGTDYTPIIFNSKYKKSHVSGGCFETIKLILLSKLSKSISFSKLQKKFTLGCSIHELKNGEASSFIKTPECDKYFYKATDPLLGTIYPVGVSRVCTIKLDDKVIFNKTIKL